MLFLREASTTSMHSFRQQQQHTADMTSTWRGLRGMLHAPSLALVLSLLVVLVALCAQGRD